MRGAKSIILFDGVCNLCNSSIDFVLKRDIKDHFRFGALQEKESQELLSKFNVSSNYLDSLVLIEENKLYFRSTAALRIARKLNSLWPILYILILIPASLRDYLYNWIGKNRYRWFGKKATCRIPTKLEKEKFLSYPSNPS
jgi:predicted DCC family thiol-disulfide oxidoreductase YuxK